LARYINAKIKNEEGWRKEEARKMVEEGAKLLSSC
jgi:hypothetical protein